MDTVKLEGRKDEPTISVQSEFGDGLSFELIGAELSTRSANRGVERWEVRARHDNGTDFEHDSAAVARLEGVALKFEGMQYGQAHFSGLLLKGAWYDSETTFEAGMKFPHDRDEVTVCEDTEYYHREGSEWAAGHLLMPYSPPERKFSPLEVRITVSYRRFIGED